MDEEERLIVTTWALQHLLPKTSILSFYQLELLIANHNSTTFSNTLEEIILANLPPSH
jgi:hypothetical protein